MNPFDNVGDKITFSWIFKLWMHEVNKTKKRKAEEEAEREKRRLEAERRRKMQEEIERRVAEYQKREEKLHIALESANETIRELEKKVKDLEKTMATWEADVAERERLQREAMEALRQQLEEALENLTATQSELESLKKDFAEATAALNKAGAEQEALRAKLEAEIKKLSSDLQQALVMAKYMRAEMLKAKREAANSVSPSKFAELIAQLEEMRESMSCLLRDFQSEKDSNVLLNKKLESNTRRMELERQFLPLLRTARGPLGPKAHGDVVPKRRDKGNWGAVSSPPPPNLGNGELQEMGPNDPSTRRVRRSASLTSVVGPRGGGPLGMG